MSLAKIDHNRRRGPTPGLVLAGLFAVTFALNACSGSSISRTGLFGRSNKPVHTGSVTPKTTGLFAATTKLARQWQKRRGDAALGLNYAAHLHALGSRNQALEVLRETATRNPKNKLVLLAYGRQLGRMGQLRNAYAVLQKVHGLGAADWRVYSAQGIILDKMAAHPRARQAYGHALRLSPRNPAVINNLAMSHALGGNLKRSEKLLRETLTINASQPKTRQNLALVVGLQGRFKEARAIASTDLPAHVVSANLAYLKKMLSQPNRWQKLKKPKKS
jgi:Flp pilus assembly protein TadD